MSDAIPPQAGWYADPENPDGERWWNGSGWSDHKRAATGFSFGAPDPAGPRPDPYAPVAPPVSTPATYASPAYAPAPYGSGPAPGTTNGLAIAGLIVSAAGWLVLGFLAPIAGIILSGFGLARAKQAEAAGYPNTGRSLALAGIIVGIVVLVLGVLIFVVYFVFLFTIGYPS